MTYDRIVFPTHVMLMGQRVQMVFAPKNFGEEIDLAIELGHHPGMQPLSLQEAAELASLAP
ncbi:MAG: hypothetical protein V4474_00235 [Patescibacteria group bacterium]